MGILKKIKQKKASTAPKQDAPVKAEKKEEKKADAPKKQEEAVVEAAPVVASTAHDIFVRPHVSEKSIASEARGVYTFVVKQEVTKVDVKNAIKTIYGVMPASVRIMNTEGKRKQRGRIRGKRQDWKKAVVTLPKGKTISIHEGV